MSGYAKRTDQTHREVIDTLRACGWTVFDTHALPGWVDCTATRHGEIRLIEIKTAKGKPTDSQRKLLEDGWPINILRNSDDAMKLR